MSAKEGVSGAASTAVDVRCIEGYTATSRDSKDCWMHGIVRRLVEVHVVCERLGNVLTGKIDDCTSKEEYERQ